MERRSLLRFSAVGAALLSGVEWLKGDLFASEALPHFDGVHIPKDLGPALDPDYSCHWLDRLNNAFAQRGAMPFQKWKRGYYLKWTGWKAGQNTTLLCAQWVAYEKGTHGWGFYSSTPGGEGPCRAGDVFDISTRSGSPHLWVEDLMAPEPVLLKKAALAKIDAYKRLLGTMREHGVRV